MTAFELRIERLERGLFDGVSGRDGEPRQRVDLAILACFADERPLRGLAALLDWRLAGAVSRLLREGFCTAARDELVLLPGRRDLPTDRIVIVGLGARAELDLAAAQRAATEAVAMALRLQPRDVLFALPAGGEDRELSEALVAGVVLGLGGEVPSVDSDVDDAAPEVARPVEVTAPRPVARVDRPDDPTDDGADAPPDAPRADVCRWWVVADPRHQGRLRRLLEGPPRAAET